MDLGRSSPLSDDLMGVERITIQPNRKSLPSRENGHLGFTGRATVQFGIRSFPPQIIVRRMWGQDATLNLIFRQVLG